MKPLTKPTPEQMKKCSLNEDAPLNILTTTHAGCRIFVYQLAKKYHYKPTPESVKKWSYVVVGEGSGGPNYDTPEEAQAAAMKMAE